MATAGSQYLLVTHETISEASLSPGPCGAALTHLETLEVQDILPSLFYLSNESLEDCNCFFLSRTSLAKAPALPRWVLSLPAT